MNTTSEFTRRVPGRGHLRSFALGVVAAIVRLAALAFPLVAQEPDSLRLWAAQTGMNQVTLAWDSVPGTAEYRIYLGDPDDEATFTQRPVTTLSAGARGGILTGMGRLRNGITLVAVDRTGRVRHRRRFNAVVPATPLPSVTQPAGLTADAPSASEVTVTWDPVPGATAYFIGRAVDRSGFRTLCNLCSTESRYVDRDVIAGVPHTYTVAAIFPNGISTRVRSNTVTPGQVASNPVAPSPGVPTAPASGSTTGSASGTPGGAGSGTPAGTASGSTSGTTSGSTAAPTSGAAVPAVGPAAPTQVTATMTGPGSVRVAWQAPTGPAVTGYYVQRNPSGGLPGMVISVAATPPWYDDGPFPASVFAYGPVTVSYQVTAITAAGAASANSNDLFLPQPKTAAPTEAIPTPKQPTSTPQPLPCRLDYQRADNMWAAWGKPDGPLGTESISVMAGQNKVFLTDWKYEKMRNDGTTYYGSHLRIATNPTPLAIRLHIRSVPVMMMNLIAGSSDNFWLTLAPNTTQEFQADLMEVVCPG